MITTRNTAIVAPPAMLAVSNITRCLEAVTRKKNFVVTFFGRARTLSCPLFASANRNARTFRENGRLKGRRKEKEIEHIVTVSAL